MVGKFTNLKVPACGLSLGFERLITILTEQGFTIPEEAPKTAFLTEKNLSAGQMAAIRRRAAERRREGRRVLVTVMNKNKKFQKDQLQSQGYGEIVQFYRDRTP